MRADSQIESSSVEKQLAVMQFIGLAQTEAAFTFSFGSAQIKRAV
jgi:hypothetical protein